MEPTRFDLKTRARKALLDAGFHPDFPPEVIRESQVREESLTNSPDTIQDLRSLPWSSIDNDQSRDLDQIEYVERLSDGQTRLLVGIADVDSLVPKGSATDQHASTEATSVYTGVSTFPMLPDELSTGRSSLLGAQDRSAVVVEMRLSMNGEVGKADIFRALVRNQAKLAYSSTGAWLEGRGPVPAALVNAPGMEAQLRLQHETMTKLLGIRKAQGALTFASLEATPVVENEQVKDLKFLGHNAAQDIIENFMVAANVAMAEHLRGNGIPSLRRVVRTPWRWDRIREIAAGLGEKLPDAPDSLALSGFLARRQVSDPAHFPDLSLSVVKLLGPGEYIVESPGAEPTGHFGLAVHDYTHATAPNRRYADLVTQRLLKAKAAATPYSESELTALAAHCTEREDAARKVERLMRKVVAASLLKPRVGETFDAVVTGASPKGTYVRLLNFPAEGRVIRGTAGMDVGDKVRVRLFSVEIEQGFIDFEKV